ncbi:hypothetical protein GCM10011403_01790 [Pseudohongiella nitratireducens]|uniref:Rnf electron transport complex subunit B n=1 Tax=Pseudohongiella nitratireducens TaxID=1768907 RepID=A0A917GJV8_9GAMM|nr:electron transport complex subunit RsxB [Pseudohongiella nitratireducens]GGG48384.1 hypothetical protein GCM10011403_01790 [Pseudohongiella nitratireducens]
MLENSQDNNTAKDSLTEHINGILPQTQCTKCGYDGCLPYAQAITEGEAINRCPPGGPEVIQALAQLTGQRPATLNPEVGEHLPQTVAYIREDECIGCTKCIQACPVDAIVGAAKLMHTVIASDCTGCDLCVEPCPVDCIDMLPVQQTFSRPSQSQSDYWRSLYDARTRRQLRHADEIEQRRLMKLQDKIAAMDAGETITRTPARKTPAELRAEIQAAVARKRAGQSSSSDK